jgi:hypothetical protein
VVNVGDEPQAFFGGNQYLYNTAGQKYESNPGAAIYLKDSKSLYEPINPGNAVNGQVVFDVLASGFSPDRIELHDSMFSGGATVSLR